MKLLKTLYKSGTVTQVYFEKLKVISVGEKSLGTKGGGGEGVIIYNASNTQILRSVHS